MKGYGSATALSPERSRLATFPSNKKVFASFDGFVTKNRKL